MHGKAQSLMYCTLKYWLWYSLILLSRTLPNSKMEVMYNSNTSHVPTAIGWLCTCTAISFSVYESTAKRTKIYAPNHNTQRRNEQIKTWYLQFVGMDLRGRIYDICRRHWLEFRLCFPWSKQLPTSKQSTVTANKSINKTWDTSLLSFCHSEMRRHTFLHTHKQGTGRGGQARCVCQCSKVIRRTRGVALGGYRSEIWKFVLIYFKWMIHK